MIWVRYLFFVFGMGLSAVAGQTGAESRVQELYGEAKAAQSQGDIAGAIAKYDAILKVDPTLGPAYNNLGTLYFRKGDFPNAVAVLEQGLKVNPAMPSAVALLGIALYETGSYDPARKQLEAALHANPKDNNVELFLAKDLSKLGDLEGAEVHLRQLTARQPGNQELWYLLATLHLKLSEKALAKMNAIDPHSVWAHELSGEVMESMNNYDGAIVELKRAVEVAPKQPGVHFKLGDAYWSQSMFDLAAAQFDAELGVNPGNCMAYERLGDILLRTNGDSEQVLTHLNKALTLCPNLVDGLADRGKVLAKLNRNAEAAKDLEMAIKTDPDEPSSHFLLAKVYRSLGRNAEAKVETETFSRLDAEARAAVANQAQEVIKNKETAH